MKKELEQKLFENYPKIFAVKPGKELMPFPMFGFECGSGWYNIIDTLCNQIQLYIDNRNSTREKLLKSNPHNFPIPDEIVQVIADQVKEKFGGLRFYTDGGDEITYAMIRMAEAMSVVTCEVCGNPGKIRGQNWYYTSCNEHAKEKDRDE